MPGIRGKEITTQRVRDFHVATPRPDSFAIGAGSGGARLAWTQDGLCFLAPLVPGVTAAGSAVALDLADAAGGSLAVVSGPETIVWAQRANTMEGAPPRWTSVLIVPRSGRIEVDGLVHAVTWWGEAVAVIGAMELLVLKRTG